MVVTNASQSIDETICYSRLDYVVPGDGPEKTCGLINYCSPLTIPFFIELR
jgi:hypothetical protein